MNLSPDVEELFHRLADLDRAQQRVFFEENPTDPEIRRTVEALLASDQPDAESLSLLINQQAGLAMNAADELHEGALCGPYRLIKALGRGGMGEVWLADRTDGFLKRPVALKLPYAGLLASHFAERLYRERDILAALVHPGIARLYDAGVDEGGRPYLALEFVEGTNLTAYCDERKLSVEDRLALFLQILNAVQHAHSRLVIHRDLKPSNILVTAEGEIKLLDFGIAKLMREGEAPETELTQLGGRALTLKYASPEQISGQPVTTASDVFSLGLILFELLSGESPFVPKRDSRGALEEAILNDEARRPSIAVGSDAHAQARSTTLKKLKAQLRGDLDQIVLKALQKQPENRYLTVDAFRADLDRHLRGDAVLAQPESRSYRVRKFVLRHKLGAFSTVAIFLALAAGLSAALWQARVARKEARTAAAVQEFTEDIFWTNSVDNPDPVKARKTSARELLDIGRRKVAGSLNDAPEAKERMLAVLGALYLDLGLDDEAVALERQRVAVAKAFYGAKNPAIVKALVTLGSSMQASRSVNEREAVLLEAKAILDASGDRSSELRGRVLSALTEHYASTDLPKSIAFASEALAVYRKWPPSTDYARALYESSITYLTAGQYADGEKTIREAISLSKKFKGDPNPDLARYYAYEAEAESNQLRYSAADESYRLAYKYSQTLGDDGSVDVLETGSRLGDFLMVTSRFHEGLPYLQRAKDACLRVRGAGDPFYAPQMLYQYGVALFTVGRPEEALEYVSQAVENRRKNRPGTRYLGQLLEGQAEVLIELGQLERAEQVMKDAEVIRKSVGQKVDKNYLIPRIRIALERGRLDDAADLVERNYGAVAANAPLSNTLLRNLDARAEIALMKLDGATAVAMSKRALDAIGSSEIAPYLKSQQAKAMLHGGRGYRLLHDSSNAIPLLEGGVKAEMELLDAGSPDLGAGQAELGLGYFEGGDKEKARAALAKSVAILRSHRQLGRLYRESAYELAKFLNARKN
jgi:eukaryotic-like serine/threonine-protein kinase